MDGAQAVIEQAGLTPRDRVFTDNKTWRTSREELERRWAVVRAHLRQSRLQALIVHGYEEKIGGGVRWLTDAPPGYPRFIIFHAEDKMTQVDHGPHGESRRIDDQDGNRPGVGEVITHWGLHGGHVTHKLAAASVADVLTSRGYTDVGLAAGGVMPHGFVAGLHEIAGGRIRFTDESEFLDAAKASKSAEEIDRIRAVATTQDEVFAKLLDWIRPGIRDMEINAFLDYQMQLLGAERGAYIGVSARMGTPAPFNYRTMQGRTMQHGDYMNVLIESNGLGGVWTEIGRVITFGKASAELVDAHEVCVQGQAYTAELSTPGADPAEIFERFNAFMVKHGSAPERRLYSHSQGYDMVERPFIRADETMKLPQHANMAVHPTFVSATTLATMCDNYLVDEPGEFLHATPKRIFEL